MKKRILASMIFLTILCLLVLSAALCIVFYRQFARTVQDDVRARAVMLKNADVSDYSVSMFDMRLTIVAPDGTVLFDDEKDREILENHADRTEIKEAFTSGVGKSLRFSDTLRQETYYYAIKMDDGSVLRLAKTTSSIWGLFEKALPVVAFMVISVTILAYFLAGRLTARIVNPINQMEEIDTQKVLPPPYDELAPFVKAISRQREKISRQVETLQNRSETIDAIMDNMNEGIILINSDGIILSVNKSATSIFSINEPPNGKNIWEVLREPQIIENIRLALSGARKELCLSRNDRIYRLYFSPVADSGAMILFLDITESSLAEKQRREFSANVSHELKTPLTTIYGNAEMMESNMVKKEDQAEFVRKIKDEAGHMIALIEDIIMLSRLDEQGGEVPMENVELGDIVREIATSLSIKAGEQNIRIDVTGAGVFTANHSQMTELCYNLIDNAVKYNKPDGSVNIRIQPIPKGVQIEVKDTGIGIPAEAQNRIFERFYRVDKSRSKKTGGTGLGLAIVKHIVMAYKGDIDLQSTEGKGTSITVSLYDPADV